MADAQKTAVQESDISIHEVKTFEAADPDSIQAFLNSLPNAVRTSGELISTNAVIIPDSGGGSRELTPAPQEKLLNPPSAEERENELYYSDIVQLLNDTAYWLVKQQDQRVLNAIDQEFRETAESKHGFLSSWGALVNNGQNVSEEKLEEYKSDLPTLVNYLQHLASIYFSEEEAEEPGEEPAPKAVEEPVVPPSSSAATPKAAPDEKEPSIQVDDVPRTDDEIEQKQQIQYEATWIYNRALHEFFVAHGIDYNYIANHPNLRNLILSETMELLDNRSEQELGLLFANPRKRLEILDQLYLNLARSPQFTTQLQQFYSDFATTLPENQRQEFRESFQETVDLLGQEQNIRTDSDEHILREELSEVLGTDSPKVVGVGTPEFTRVTGSVQTAVDAMILNHGVDFEVVGFTSEEAPALNSLASDPHNAIWLIKKMSSEHLRLMLGVPDNLTLDQEAVGRLRQILIRYARMRAVQLAQENENLKTSQGLNRLSDEDAEAIADHNTSAVQQALLPAHQATSESIKEYGTETTSQAISTSVKKQKQKELAQWNLLSDEEKLLVYQYFGISADEIGDLKQLPNQIRLFNLRGLVMEAQEIEIRAQEARAQAQEAELQALLEKQAAIGQALDSEILREFAYRQEEAAYINEVRQNLIGSYLNDTAAAQQQLIMQQLAVESQQQLQQASLMEIMAADQAAIDSTAEERAGGVGGRISEALTSRFGGRLSGLAKKLGPKQKAVGALKKAAGAKLKQAAAKKLLQRAALVAGPIAAGAALLTDKDTRNFVAGGLAYVVSGIIKALQTAGGFAAGTLGGILGGVGGFFIGGIPGAAVGATIGAGLGGQIGSTALGGKGLVETAKGWFTGEPAAATTPTAAQINAAQAGTAATTGGAGTTGGIGVAASTLPTTAEGGLGASITGLSIGVLAPIGALFVVIISSLTVLLIIQGSFLITLPDSLSSRTFRGTLSGFEGCWPTTGVITVYETYGDGSPHATISDSYHGFDGPGVAIDIGTASNSSAQGGINPPIYTPYAGTATFYPDGTGVVGEGGNYPYGNYVAVDTGDFLLIFAHMLQFPQGVSMSSITSNVEIRAGELVGMANTTGNSTGNHLHYEVVGGGVDIIDIVPLTESQREAAREDQSAILGIRVDSNECSQENIEAEQGIQGYVAVGPMSPDNLVVSQSSLTQSPQHPCTWYQNNSNLAVATNANFYNTAVEPVGAGGTNPAYYFANAENVNNPENFTLNTLRYLAVTNNGNIEFSSIPLDWYNNPNKPLELPNISKAVTGVVSSIDDNGQERNRIAIGTGSVNGQCADYTGEAFIFGAMRSATYQSLAEMMQRCGAEEFIFLDGGASASFCSADQEIRGGREMPVNVGLNQAEVEAVTNE